MMKLSTTLLLFFTFFFAKAQEPFPFWNEVQALKKKDSVAFPAPAQILFIGSSSFTLLRDTANIFPGYKIVNRAFGGSTLADVARYRYEVIYPYQPKQIVLYCGENDLASSDTVTVEMVVQRFKTLYQFIRAKYPAVPFVYVSVKPSPSRYYLFSKIKEVNNNIKAWLQLKTNTKFVNVFDAMLKANGAPDESLFRNDMLHMNPKGYAIWKKILQPYLIK
jgi:lysophospholipase L1-like esterase